ncbi:MAG: GIY-YIG nuclease family protein [Saprospiraceae bacterium]
MEIIYTVYSLFSAIHNKIYIGYTSDLLQRFHSHNKYGTKDWTKNFRPWIVVYTEVFESKTEAINREKMLKSYRGRQFIQKECIPQYFR